MVGLFFGNYYEVNDKTNPIKSTVARMHEAIALVSNGILQGTQNLFYINIGPVLNKWNFTGYPMTDRVINKVKKWGDQTTQ